MKEVLATKATLKGFSLVAIFAYLGIDSKVLGLYIALILLSFCIEMIKEITFREFSIYGMFSWLMSRMLLLLVMFSFGIFGQINEYDMSHIMSGIFFALSLTELYSILSSAYETKIKKRRPEKDIIAVLLGVLLNGVRRNLYNLFVNMGDDESQKRNNKQ